MYSFYYLAALLDPNEIKYSPTIKDAGDLDLAVVNILMTVYLIAGMVAVLVIVLAGYMFAMSNGNPDRVKRARYMILGASVGLVVILMAFLVTQLVINWAVEGV